ncbi:glycosyltransferase family 4 protein [Chitinophaga niabensis]|uniref:Glycosyltransferase involved in cell wall bisynthesis n=1 Tax=Chitinophaga niabensis TaxID=536979 RepID=A0A1N6DP82_9BACT|nr:glycosyltransferase family 4 protein [Chitinophaga niabensis]SIN72473.1 Glycosyltransferase involved in cell wall bisynthesis [Chitinophaga niabensis]
MKIAILSPVAWRTPPEHYGPWEQMASNVAEGLVQHGWDVTLFATGNSHTAGTLKAICATGYEEDKTRDAKVMECMHISYLMEQAADYAIIHNHFDFLPLTYSRLINTPMVTTIHGFSSEKIIPVYKRYNDINHYVSISNSDRHPELDYAGTVYNGIDPAGFDYCETPEDYLLFFGRLHPHKGAHDAITLAKKTGHRLIIAGIIQDEGYYNEKIKPYVDGEQIRYIGPAGPKERNTLLGKAKALLHPIYFEEPFGLSVAEAMMCGTPVIAYRRGSMPELIINGETGYLVNDLHEAAEKINTLPEISRAACRMWAIEQFSMQKMVKDYVRIYESLNLL